MLHILLLILKIIGIIVLLSLGLLLSSLLLVLLVPVRYRVNGSYYGKLKGYGKVTWLLHMLSVTVSYGEQPEAFPKVTVRFFGIRLFHQKKQPAMMDLEDEDIIVQAMEVPDDSQIQSPAPEQPDEKPGKEPEKEPGIEPGTEPGEQHSSGQPEDNKNALPETDHLKQPSGLKAARVFFKRILSKLKFSYRRICDTLKQMKDKKEQLQAFVSNPENQATAKLLWRQIKKILRHTLPVKGKGTCTFGFEDPYMTGQVLTWVSVIYPFCHKFMEFQPVFDRQILEGEGSFRGRIRTGSLLVTGGRLLLDKNIRKIIKKLLR